MIGINLVQPKTNEFEVPFNHEVRKVRFIEHQRNCYIAVGDKSGLLKILNWCEGKLYTLHSKIFKKKIVSMDFVINKNKIGILVAIEQSSNNLFYIENILNNKFFWCLVRHHYNMPYLIFQPHAELGINCLCFTFDNCNFIVGKLIKKNSKEFILDDSIFDGIPQIPHRIIDACAEIPKNYNENRKLFNSYRLLYLASQTGDIFSLIINNKGYFEVTHIAKSSGAIRSIIPIRRLKNVSDDLEGIIGISGAELFCVYKNKKDRVYKKLILKYSHNLQSIGTLFYKIPKTNKNANVILIADASSVIHFRQLYDELSSSNIQEALFEKRKIFSQELEDKVFGIVPLANNKSEKSLVSIGFGMGSNRFKVLDFLNKDYVIEQLEIKLDVDFKIPLKEQIDDLILLATKYEYSLEFKYELIAILFSSRKRFEFYKQTIENETIFFKGIVLIYWILSFSDRKIQIYLFNAISNIIKKIIEEKNLYVSRKKTKYYHINLLNSLLNDIQRYWTWGKAYSKKIGNIVSLISISKNISKNFDEIIFKGIINDRSFSIISSSKLSKKEIWSIQKLRQYFLVSCNDGYLYLLDNKLSILQKLYIRDYNTFIYSNSNNIHNLENNFIRKIITLPETNWIAFLLWSGGIWLFDASIFNSMNFKLKDIFSNGNGLLLASHILPYKIKWSKNKKFAILSDRFGNFFKIEKNIDNLFELKTIIYKENKSYNPVWDFDFLDTNNLIYGDRSGKIVKYNLKEKKETIIFKTDCYFNTIFAININNVIIGSEEGLIVSYNFSDENEIICNWSYILSGPIRFMTKAINDSVMIGGLGDKYILIKRNGKIFETIYPYVETENIGKSIQTNCYYSLGSRFDEDEDKKHNRLSIILGTTDGKCLWLKIYEKNLYEKDIEKYFIENTGTLNSIKLRTSNIDSSSIRRMYERTKMKQLSISEIEKDILKYANSKMFDYYMGSLYEIIPYYFSKYKQFLSAGGKMYEFDNFHESFQSTINVLSTTWGGKSNRYCENVTKIILLEFYKLLLNKTEYLNFINYYQTNKNSNIREIDEIIDDLNVKLKNTTLIDMYILLIEHVESLEIVYPEFIIDKICKNLSGKVIDTSLPDPLFLRQIELLSIIHEKTNFCPMKLISKLLSNNIYSEVIIIIANKSKMEINNYILESFYKIIEKIKFYDNFLEEFKHFTDLYLIAEFNIKDNDLFYIEVTYIIENINMILSVKNYLDLFDINFSEKNILINRNTCSELKRLIRLINNIKELLSKMKNLVSICLEPTYFKNIPFKKLLMLRKNIRKLYMTTTNYPNASLIYLNFHNCLIEIVENITDHFCEVTLPAEKIRKINDSLEKYLKEAKANHSILPSVNDHETVDLYNSHFIEMFKILIVCMEPSKGVYKYFELNKFDKKAKYLAYSNGNIIDIKALNQDFESNSISEQIFLPTDKDLFSEYFYCFDKKDILSKKSSESMQETNRQKFMVYIKILSDNIRAFENICKAESESRLGHMLFSHQSQEPLFSLNNYLENMLKPNFKDPNGIETKNYHERMLMIVKDLKKRCKYILQASKMFKEIQIETQKIKFFEHVNLIVKNCRKIIDYNFWDGEIKFASPEKPEIIIFTDENKFHEILENLIKNSLKYCVGYRRVDISVDYDSKNCYIKISDNGFGIPENELPMIYKLYFRGNEPTKRNIEGDGLGLYACHAYIDALGGIIKIQNNIGSNGINVYIKIPRNYKVIKGDIYEKA